MARGKPRKKVSLVRCINEPRGDAGLEGYQQGDTYLAENVDLDHLPYWRIWPVPGDMYYETVSKRLFPKYFEVVENEKVD